MSYTEKLSRPQTISLDVRKTVVGGCLMLKSIICLEAEYLYKVKDILEVFLREYVEELFRFYEHYCENQSELK